MSHSERAAFFWPGPEMERACSGFLSRFFRFDLGLHMVGYSNATLTTQLTATERYFSLSLSSACAIRIRVAIALALLQPPVPASLSIAELDDIVSTY